MYSSGVKAAKCVGISMVPVGFLMIPRDSRNYPLEFYDAFHRNTRSAFDTLCVLTKNWRQHERHFYNGMGDVAAVAEAIDDMKATPPAIIEMQWDTMWEMRQTKSGVKIATRQGQFPSPGFIETKNQHLLPDVAQTARVLFLQPIDVPAIGDERNLSEHLEEPAVLQGPGFRGAGSRIWTQNAFWDKVIDESIDVLTWLDRFRRGGMAMAQPQDSCDFRREGQKIPYVVLLPSFGENHCQRCIRVSEMLVESGCGVVLVENPMRGARAPEGYDGVMDTVAQILAAGYGVVQDARHVMKYLEHSGYNRLCMAGISMGGEMATLAAACCPVNCAVTPLMGGHSATPIWTDASLSCSVHWEKMAEELVGRTGLDARAARDVAEGPLGVPLGNITDYKYFKRPPCAECSVQVHPRYDAFVPLESAEELNKHLQGELRVVPGGHVRGFMTMHIDFFEAIRDSLRKLDAKLDQMAQSER